MKVGGKKSSKGQQRPEFWLAAAGIGCVWFVAKDHSTVNALKRVVGRWRVKMMRGDIQQRNSTLGDYRRELSRKMKMFESENRLWCLSPFQTAEFLNWCVSAHAQLGVTLGEHFVVMQEANPGRTQLLGPTRNLLSVPIANLLTAAQL